MFKPQLRRARDALRDALRLDQAQRVSVTTGSPDDAKVLTGRLLAHTMRNQGPVTRLCDAGFKVFSQFDDDGIIQYLIDNVEAPVPEIFVEFGVEDYQESNTRFLLVNNNWSGLIMDGNPANIQFVQGTDMYWRHDLRARAAFITAENINSVLAAEQVQGEVGVLSIDIDGNDYWVWNAVQVVDPVIVVVEYNSLFGATAPVAVPYAPGFMRQQAHWSCQYWGAGIGAFCHLAEKKNYSFVGCNGAGNNAYFVKTSRLGRVHPHSPSSGYAARKFRDARAPDGKLTFLGHSQSRALIEDMPLVNVVTGGKTSLKSLGA